jgi:two-component system nitrate/nitrite response regulator NarL
VSGYFVDVSTCDAFVKFLELVMLGETVVSSSILPFIQRPEEKTITKEKRKSLSSVTVITNALRLRRAAL